MPAPSKSSQVFSRIVAPLLIFVAVVAGAAWLVQNLPSIREKAPEKDFTNLQGMLKFAFEEAKWGERNPKNPYGEFEVGAEGEFDFPFDNVSGHDIETGLDHTNCACSDVKVAVFPPGSANDASALSWTVLTKTENKSDAQALIPKGSSGIYRLAFKAKPPVQTIKALVWVQSKETRIQQYQWLSVNIHIVPPIFFLPDKLEFGTFRDHRSGSFLCWSSTRDLRKKPDDTVKLIDIDVASAEPGFEFTITELPDSELGPFQRMLEQKKIPSRARSIVRIDVKVTEKTSAGYLDQGYFNVKVPLLIRGEKFAQGPAIAGYVHSDIVILNADDGRIRLGTFSDQEGIRPKQFIIQADPNVTMLTLIRSPKTLDVKLDKVQDSVSRWRLEIAVPPNTVHFPPPGSAIITLVSQPTRFYLAQIVSSIGNAASDIFGPLPVIVDLSQAGNSWGIGARQVHVPILEAVSR